MPGIDVWAEEDHLLIKCKKTAHSSQPLPCITSEHPCERQPLSFRLELVRRVKIVIVLRGTSTMPLITGWEKASISRH
jgi:hypothetical protein